MQCTQLLLRVCLAGRRLGAPAGSPPGGSVGGTLPAHLCPSPHLPGYAEPDEPWGPGQGGKQQPLTATVRSSRGPLALLQLLVRSAISKRPRGPLAIWKMASTPTSLVPNYHPPCQVYSACHLPKKIQGCGFC